MNTRPATRFWWFGLLGAVILIRGSVCFAIITAPKSYVEISPDGTRLLVMLDRPASHDVVKPVELPDGRVVDLRLQFEVSGIYDLKTFELESEIEWFVTQGNILWNDDFSSIVALNEFAAYSPGTWALAFVRDGIIIKYYRCDELLTDFKAMWWLPLRSWNWFYDWHDYEEFEKEGSRVHVATASRCLSLLGLRTEIGFQEFYEFDFETGEVLSQRVDDTKLKVIIVVCGMFFLLLIGISIWGVKLLWRKAVVRACEARIQQ